MPAHLARLLVDSGVIGQSAADEALRRHVAVGGALDTVLLEAGLCTEPVLLSYLSQAADLPAATAGVYAAPDPRALAAFPFKLADRHTMVPIELGKRYVEIAAAYPVEKLLLEELSFMLGKDLRPRVAIEARLREAIARLYNKPLSPRYATLLRKLGHAPSSLELPSVATTPRPISARPPSGGLGKATAGSVAAWPPPPPDAAVPVTAAPLPPVKPMASTFAIAWPPHGVDTVPNQLLPSARPDSGSVDAAQLLGFDQIAAGPQAVAPLPVLEGEAPSVPAADEEDAAALLPPDEPPPPPTIELEVAPEVPLEVEPAPVESAPAPASEVAVAADLALKVSAQALVDPAPEDASPEPAPPAAEAAEPFERPVEQQARPPTRSADVSQLLAGWRAGPEGLDSLGDALAGVLAGIDPSAFSVEPVPDLAEAEAAAPAPEAAPEPSPARVQGWTLSEARSRLHQAHGRDEILDVALTFALKSFDFAAALAVRAGTAFGWTALGSEGEGHLEQVQHVALPLDAPSVLRTVLRARGRYLGPLPEDELTDGFLRDLGRERPLVALLYPVFVRERPVAIFYADRGRRHVAAPRVAEFLLFAQEIATAFERAILASKAARSAPEPGPSPADAPNAPPTELALSVNPADAGPPEDELFPITEEPPVYVPAVRPLAEVLGDLLGLDRRKRLAAMVELTEQPEAAAAALAAHFPGPTAMRRGLVVELPDAEELGPVLGALARLGGAAIPAIDHFLREGDPDQRFFAVLLAGTVRRPELFTGLLPTLFDPVVEVAAAARAAVSRLRDLAGFEDGIASFVRKQLGASDPDRVASAALAIGRTRDIAAIPLLIPLTGHADDRVAAEASDALTQITKQTHGDSPRRWQAWWDQNRSRPRVAWLVEGLAHKDVQVRLAAIEELVELTNDSLGYLADGPRKEREKALVRWDQWLASRLR